MKRIKHAFNRHKDYLSKQFILFIVSLALFLSSFLFTKLAYSAAPMIWQSAQYGKMLTSLGFKFNDDKEVRTFTVDPSAGAGVAAPVGSYGARDNAGSGELWFKYGVADTDWSNILTGVTGWSLIGNAGTTPGTNFLGTTDAQDLQIRTNGNLQTTFLSAGGLNSNQTFTPVDGTTKEQYYFQQNAIPTGNTTTANETSFRNILEYDLGDAGFDHDGQLLASSSRLSVQGSGTVGYGSVNDLSAIFPTSGGVTTLYKGNNLDTQVGSGYEITTYGGVNSFLTSTGGIFGNADLFSSSASLNDATIGNTTSEKHSLSVAGTSVVSGSMEGADFNTSISGSASTNNIYGANIGMAAYGTSTVNNPTGLNVNSQFSDTTVISGNINGIANGVDVRDGASVQSVTGNQLNVQVRGTSTATNVVGENVGLSTNDTAALSSATALNVNPNFAGTSTVTNVNMATIGGTLQDNVVASNVTGLGLNPQLVNNATATNFTALSVAPQLQNAATVTNGITAIQTSVNTTAAISQVKGLSINVSNANVVDPFAKKAIETDGGSVTMGYGITIPGATSFFQNHYIGGSEIVASGDPTSTYGFGNNFAHAIDFQDDWGPDVTTLRLGFVDVGFVGQVNGTAGKTMDSWTGALGGFGNSSGAGTLDQAIMFRAAGGLNQGGALTINNVIGFQGMPTLCGIAVNCWGVRIDDPLAANLFEGTVQTNDALILQDPGAGTNTTTIQAATLGADYTLTLPTTDGGASEVLTTDGSGVLSWNSVASLSGAWNLLGNAGTNAGTNFLGTTDTVDLVFRTDNTERFRITSTGSLDTTLGAGIVHSDASGILTSSAVSLTTDVSGVLPLANGGTNKNATASAGAFVYSDADSFELSSVGTDNYLVQSGGTGAPTFLAFGTANQLFGTNAAGTDFENKAVTATSAGALTAPGILRSNTSLVLEDPGAGANTITIQSPTLGGDFTFTLPVNDGNATEVLTTDGSGVLTWTDPIPPTSAIGASAIDWSLGNVFSKTLSANTTFTFSNVKDGKTIVVRVTNTASNYTLAWPTVKWAGGVAPTQTIGAKSDVYTFISDGTDIFGSVVQDMY